MKGKIMELKENLIVLRNILYKCFLVGLFFLIIATVLYMPCKCLLANIYQIGFGISPELYYSMWVSFIGLIKTILIFLFLVPALAIHWVGHDYKKTM
jgi:hypothetical protein